MINEPNILLLLTPKSVVSYLTSDLSVRQGLESFRAHGYTAVPMIDSTDGTYCGIVTEGDFLRKIVSKDSFTIQELEEENIRTVLHGSFKAVDALTSFSEVIDLLENQNFVPVVDDRNVFMGIITRKSCITYLRKRIAEYKESLN